MKNEGYLLWIYVNNDLILEASDGDVLELPYNTSLGVHIRYGRRIGTIQELIVDGNYPMKFVFRRK